MSKTYRPYEPMQSYLLPPSPQEWLPRDHLAYFVLDLVQSLDISSITAMYEREERGYPPHHPRMKTYEDIAFRVLAADQHPDHTRVSEFRCKHLASFRRLFVEVLQLCQQAGMVKLGHVAIDGTKVKANASKHKAMSYERMKQEEHGRYPPS